MIGLLIGILLKPIIRCFTDSHREQSDRVRLVRESTKQDIRDRLARKLASRGEGRFISDILSGRNTSPYALYLRPFALEKKIRQRDERISLWQLLLPHNLLDHILLPQKINFDLNLQTYFDPLGITLISIGHPNNQEGAGHVITTDSSWQEHFRQLAKRATTIIVVPGFQEGILSEIRWLRESNLLVNAVFFKPVGYPKAAWEKMHKLYEKEENIKLPPYSRKQLSFRMYPSGRCYDVLTWAKVYRKRKKDMKTARVQAALLNNPLKITCTTSPHDPCSQDCYK